MSQVAFVAFSGLRVRDEQLAQLGVTLPGLAARAEAVGELPSLGLLTLAGMLPGDWSASYHEANGDLEGLVETIVVEQPTLVAISALTPSIDAAYAFAGRLRRENIRTVLGGLHVTACPDEAARHASAICTGEGELTFPAMLADVAANRLQTRYDAVRTAAPLPWPMPRFELAAARPRSRWTLQTQRGCPLSCEFCAASRLLSRFREKPAAAVRSELAALRQVAPNAAIELADDNTFAGPRDPAPLLDVLAEAGVLFFTEVDWRLGERPELLSRLAASGCVQVLVGVESLVFQYSGMGAKDASLDRIMRALNRIQDSGIAVNGCFVVGADGETRDSIDRLGSFLAACPLADVQVTLSTPFPGSPLRARLERQGRLLAGRPWSHYTLFDVTFQPDRMSADELQSAYRQLLLGVYDQGQSRRRGAIRREVWRRHPRLNGANR